MPTCVLNDKMPIWVQLYDEFCQQFAVPLDTIVEFGHLAPCELVNNKPGPTTYVSVLQNGEIKRIKCWSTYEDINYAMRDLR